jgi:RNA polymerase sigma-70 factor (ECF subfamily)
VFLNRRVDSGEFEAVAVPHLNDLYRTAAHLVRDRTEAQDLVQNVYLLAWKSFHRFEPGTNCRAWLFKILFNEIRHYRRKWYNKKVVSEGERSIEETLPYEPPIPEEIRDEDILTALDQISADFREVILMADVHEFAYKEIAELLSIPIGTVMSRLNRGRKQLRAKLAVPTEASGPNDAREEVRGL